MIEESVNIVTNAQKAREESGVLEKKYKTARKELEKKLNSVKSTKERANDLFTKALNLVAKVTTTQDSIQKLEDSNQGDELDGLERQLQALIKRMNEYTASLEKSVYHYKSCNT